MSKTYKSNVLDAFLGGAAVAGIVAAVGIQDHHLRQPIVTTMAPAVSTFEGSAKSDKETLTRNFQKIAVKVLQLKLYADQPRDYLDPFTGVENSFSANMQFRAANQISYAEWSRRDGQNDTPVTTAKAVVANGLSQRLAPL